MTDSYALVIMSLISCRECNSRISNKAHSCPHCGYPMKSRNIIGNIFSSFFGLIGICLSIIILIPVVGIIIRTVSNVMRQFYWGETLVFGVPQFWIGIPNLDIPKILGFLIIAFAFYRIISLKNSRR